MNWRRWVELILRVLLALVFVYAAWAKLRESWLLFAMAIDAYGVLPQWAVVALARTLPWLELALGILLLTGFRLRETGLAASALLAVFFTVMLRSYAKGMEIDCACFGGGEVISVKTLLRDGLFVLSSMALTVLAFRPTSHKTKQT